MVICHPTGLGPEGTADSTPQETGKTIPPPHLCLSSSFQLHNCNKISYEMKKQKPEVSDHYVAMF
jgi:hypothetical protein